MSALYNFFAPDQTDQDGNDGDNQENMDKAADGELGDDAKQPQYHENNRNGIKHRYKVKS